MILQSECAAKFGNPADPTWGGKHIVHVKCPWQLYMGELKIPYIKINLVAADSLERVLAHVWDWAGKDPEKIKSIHADQFSGDWVVRQARGLRMISMHAYGLAIDFDAPHNQLGSFNHYFSENNPLVKAFRDEEWVWGGAWSRPDAMHFRWPRFAN
jgi:hypothetical protein